MKASARGPQRTAPWSPRGLRAPFEKPWASQKQFFLLREKASYMLFPVSQWKPRGEQEQFAPNWSAWSVFARGVRSLKFLTPTPLLLRLNILRLRSDSGTYLSFGLRLLLKLQSECYKLLAVFQRPYPVFALKRRKKRIKRNCWDLQNMWPLLYMSVASQIEGLRWLLIFCNPIP